MLSRWMAARVSRFAAVLCAIAALRTGAAAARKQDIAELEWKQLNVEGDPHHSHPAPRYSFAAGTIAEGKSLVISHGYAYRRGAQFYQDSWLLSYKPPSTWSRAGRWQWRKMTLSSKAIPSGRLAPCSATYSPKPKQDYLIMFGGTDGGYAEKPSQGFQGGKQNSELWILDINAKSWTQYLGLSGFTWPPARYLCAAGTLADEDGFVLLIHGGLGVDGPLGDTWILDLNPISRGERPLWSEIKTKVRPSPRTAHSMAVRPDTGNRWRAVLHGGMVPGKGKSFNDVWEFSLETKSWRREIDAHPRSYHSMTFLDDTVFILGGITDTMPVKTVNETASLFDGSWKRLIASGWDPPVYRHHADILRTSDEIMIVVLGGESTRPHGYHIEPYVLRVSLPLSTHHFEPYPAAHDEF